MREIVSPLSGIRSPFGARRNPLAAYRAGGFTPKLVADFADEFYAKEGRKSTFDGVLEHTATTNATMVDSDGLLKWRPHNIVTHPFSFTTGWGTLTQGDGVTPVITNNAGVAPNGTSTAARMQMSRGSVGSPNRSALNKSFTVQAGFGFEAGIWVKSYDGSEYDIVINLAGTTGAKSVLTVDSTWRKISTVEPIAPNSSGAVSFRLGITDTDTDDLTADILMWGASLKGAYDFDMVDDPSPYWSGDPQLVAVDNQSAAVYLARRGHHIYNGSAWVNEGVLTEPSTQTNKPHGGYSAPKNGTTNTTGLTISDDAGVGFAGAGTGPRVTGSGSAGTQRMHLGAGDATYKSTAQVYIAKSSTHKYYQIINSSDANAYANFDLNDGSLGNVGSAWSADGIVNVVDHETFYELIVNDTVASSVPRYLYFVDSKTASWASSSATSDYGDIPYVGNIHQSSADNTFPALPIICNGSQVARAGEQLVLPHENISWPSGDELSIHIQGRMTYGDEDTSLNVVFVRWQADVNNRIQTFLNTTGSEIGQVRFQQETGGVNDVVFEATSSYSPGVNVPFNVASRHGSTFINGAVDGTALTEDTTPTSLPDLETTYLQLAYSGGSMVLKEVSLWDVDITDAGTEDATDD